MTIPKRNQHLKRSRLQERKGAERYGGTQNSGSGSGWIRKADVRTENELIEFKTTTKGSFNLRASDLQKLWNQALLDGNRIPIFEIEFAEDGVTCVVLDREDWMAIKD